jgi:BASS family bile acid:Na+ symporter
MPIDTVSDERALTALCLGGLLLDVGLRLTVREVVESLRSCRLPALLAANFVGVPLLVVLAARAFHLNAELAVGMILLGAAPFAPVVPVFAKLARADLALAAGLTALFAMLSALLTPAACTAAMLLLPRSGALKFDVLKIFVMLTATITIPLAIGVAIHYWVPALARRVLRPVEVLSQALGALSLGFVTVSEFGSILQFGSAALVAMTICSELALVLGYSLGGARRTTRQVLALGTSNRNIALALLLAIQSYPNTTVVPAVVANGLLLILLGLIHVAFFRFIQNRTRPAQAEAGHYLSNP